MGKDSIIRSWVGGVCYHFEKMHKTTQMEHENETATDDATECPSDRTRSKESSRAANVPSARGPTTLDVDAAAISTAATATTTAAATTAAI